MPGQVFVLVHVKARPPRRTIRFLLFGGEEQGLLGSTAYVRQHSAEMARIEAVLITDTESAPAKGWYVMGREDEKGAVAVLKPLLSGRQYRRQIHLRNRPRGV